MSRQSNIIARQSYPFSTSSISSGAGTSQGKISQTTFMGKGNYQSTGTPSKMKIFNQNSSSSNQNLQGGNKGTKVMVHKEKGQGKISVVKKAKINLLDGGDSCNVSSTHSIRDSHLATPLSHPVDKKASY